MRFVIFTFFLVFNLISQPVDAGLFDCVWQNLNGRRSHEDQEKLKSRLDRTFQENYDSDEVYHCDGHCYGNVIRLYKKFKQANPDIKPKEFKVLYITTPSRVKNPADLSNSFNVQNARGGPLVDWIYHVVLEYKGRVYDLDYTMNPTPVDGPTYVEKFFYVPEKGSFPDSRYYTNKEDLLVFAIPGDKYLLAEPEVAITRKFQRDLMSIYKPVPLIEYFLRDFKK